ncbi:MAG: phytochrome sensor protein [Candidatus Nealsonbacteria bacterium CG23_combo_of_CG06-09_8_20_14_all_36_12]|uniref:Phytochrome sensor protein n=1 Tax=Candidatus Nealsonbacteria bacterium CG23_combo_of_CG06-09_8_20_14_all_36_12 TaxID=1974718 RepID=A0A2G9YZY7_9BACT|nr:MAG: phytochrome sensor protein [Candidatus Nealsonbacteria bacterium CG23_combo_of_CG06-09_8_20_14_all_36_12]
MRFNYTARTKEGEIQMGVITAASPEVATALLQKTGLYVTSLEETTGEPIYAKKIYLFRRIARKDVVLFSRQLSILVSSEIPLVEALRTLASQTKNPEFQEKISEISEEVEGGTTFSTALSHHPKIFSSFFINLVKSGEASGKLSQVLSYLAEHLEKDYYLTSKIRGAMFYPAFVLATLFVVLTIMIIFVLPQLIGILKESGAQLPIITRILMVFVDFLREKGWIILLLLIFGAIFLWRWTITPKGKDFFDKISIRLPFFGDFLKMVYLSRFAENLSTLISGGLPITKSLEITAEVMGNSVYREIILKIRDGVRRGESISQVLTSFPKETPPLLTQMIMVGEKTGRLDSILINISDFYQKEIEVSISNLLSLIEPVLVVFLGLVVGFFVASILLPIYSGISGI